MIAIDDRGLRDEVIGFLMAGHQTTGAALAWTWYLLGRHPEVERRLAQEVTQALGGRTPSAGDLDRLGYARQVIDESMRLYPPGWAFTRTPIRDDELGGHPIPAKSVIVSFTDQHVWAYQGSQVVMENAVTTGIRGIGEVLGKR